MLRLLTRLYHNQPKDPRLISVAISLPKANSTAEVLDIVSPLLQDKEKTGFCLRAVARSIKSSPSIPFIDTDPRYIALKQTLTAEMDQISLQSLCDVSFWLRVMAETSERQEMSASDQQRFMQRAKHFALQGAFRNRQLAALLYDFSILKWQHRELENLLADRLRSQLEVFTIVELKLVIIALNHWGLRVKMNLFDPLAQRITRSSLSFADQITMVEMHSAAESLSQRYSWPSVSFVKERLREAIVTKFPALSIPAIFHAFLAYIVNPVVVNSLELPVCKALPALIKQADFHFLQQLILYLSKMHVVNRERFPTHIAQLGIEALKGKLAVNRLKQVEQMAFNISEFKQWITPELCEELGKIMAGREMTLGHVAMTTLKTALGQTPGNQAEIAAIIGKSDLYISLMTYSRLKKCQLDETWSPIIAQLEGNIESMMRKDKLGRLISSLLGLERKGRLNIATDLPLAVQFILNALKTEQVFPVNAEKILNFLMRVALEYPQDVNSILESKISTVSIDEFQTFIRTMERKDRIESLISVMRLREELGVACVFHLFRVTDIQQLKAQEISDICRWINLRGEGNNIGDAGFYGNFHSVFRLMRANKVQTENFAATLLREILARSRIPAFALKIFHYLSTITSIPLAEKQAFLAKAVETCKSTGLVYLALQGVALSEEERAQLLSIGFTESGCDLRDRYLAVCAQKEAALLQKLRDNLTKHVEELPIDLAIECVESLREELTEEHTRDLLQLLLAAVLQSSQQSFPSIQGNITLLGLLADFKPTEAKEIARLVNTLREDSWYLTAAERAAVSALTSRLPLLS